MMMTKKHSISDLYISRMEVTSYLMSLPIIFMIQILFMISISHMSLFIITILSIILNKKLSLLTNTLSIIESESIKNHHPFFCIILYHIHSSFVSFFSLLFTLSILRLLSDGKYLSSSTFLCHNIVKLIHNLFHIISFNKSYLKLYQNNVYPY